VARSVVLAQARLTRADQGDTDELGVSLRFSLGEEPPLLGEGLSCSGEGGLASAIVRESPRVSVAISPKRELVA